MLKLKKEIYNAIIFKRENPDISLTKIANQFHIDRHTLGNYIRGIIDGDGYVCKNVNQIGACGSKEVMEFIHHTICQNIELSYAKCIYYDKRYNIYRLRYSGKNALKVMEYLYKDSTIYLNRKYDLVNEKLNGRVEIKQNR